MVDSLLLNPTTQSSPTNCELVNIVDDFILYGLLNVLILEVGMSLTSTPTLDTWEEPNSRRK
jgi:hypothetical protein